MLKKGMFAAAGLTLLMGLFFGRDAFSYVRTTMGWVHDSVKDSVPVEFELQRARKMIQELDPEITRHKRAIAREELELQKLAEKVGDDKEKLSKSWGDIQRLRDDLSRQDSSYVYAGRSYSEQQVENDLTARFERYETKFATVDKLGKIVDARGRGLEAAQEKLKAMISARRQLEVEVENLEARLKMVEVAKASSEFSIDESQLSRTRELLREIEARIEVDAQLVNADDLVLDEIPLDEPAAKSNILERITQYEQQDQVQPERFTGVEIKH